MFQTRTRSVVLRSPSSQEMDLPLDIFVFNIVTALREYKQFLQGRMKWWRSLNDSGLLSWWKLFSLEVTGKGNTFGLVSRCIPSGHSALTRNGGYWLSTCESAHLCYKLYSSDKMVALAYCGWLGRAIAVPLVAPAIGDAQWMMAHKGSHAVLLPEIKWKMKEDSFVLCCTCWGATHFIRGASARCATISAFCCAVETEHFTAVCASPA